MSKVKYILSFILAIALFLIGCEEEHSISDPPIDEIGIQSEKNIQDQREDFLELEYPPSHVDSIFYSNEPSDFEKSEEEPKNLQIEKIGSHDSKVEDFSPNSYDFASQGGVYNAKSLENAGIQNNVYLFAASYIMPITYNWIEMGSWSWASESLFYIDVIGWSFKDGWPIAVYMDYNYNSTMAFVGHWVYKLGTHWWTQIGDHYFYDQNKGININVFTGQFMIWMDEEPA